VPCPHFSPENNDCRLLEENWEGEEERGAVKHEDHAPRTWCLSAGDDYRKCSVFRTYMAQLLR